MDIKKKLKLDLNHFWELKGWTPDLLGAALLSTELPSLTNF